MRSALTVRISWEWASRRIAVNQAVGDEAHGVARFERGRRTALRIEQVDIERASDEVPPARRRQREMPVYGPAANSLGTRGRGAARRGTTGAGRAKRANPGEADQLDVVVARSVEATTSARKLGLPRNVVESARRKRRAPRGAEGEHVVGTAVEFQR
jgi:hypothetical protein